MNAHTTITPEGNIPIPRDVIERLGLKPGMDIVIDERGGVIRLKPLLGVFAPDMPRVSTEELLARPRVYTGPPKSTEEISGLSDEALRAIFAEQERNARD
jgi:bifunctional DNA-binding transcriptional regulator/antitoxin component of YhaV-PrlF toxin-antitoxin module